MSDTANRTDRPDLLIAARSGRALASAARRAGFTPLVLDLFAHEDTKVMTRGGCRLVGHPSRGFDAEQLIAAVAELAPLDREPSTPLVVGDGFEGRDELPARLAMGRSLLGNPPSISARFEDPGFLAELCLAHRIRLHGGDVVGRGLSVLFLADAGRARVLGLSEAWFAGDGSRPGGAMGPVTLPASSFAELRAWLDDLTAASGLRGLNTAEIVAAEDGLHLRGLAPVPGRGLDLFDRRKGPSLLAAHVEACQGRLRAPRLEAAGLRGMQVLYADGTLRLPEGFDWPDWAADKPAPGCGFVPGEPVCTVFATAESAEALRRVLDSRASAILSRLEPGGPDARCA